MKIGILTLPLTNNYGGILQAVALTSLLSKQGCDVVLISKKVQSKLWKQIARSILEITPGHNIHNVKTDKIRSKIHEDFIFRTIPKISPRLITTDDLVQYAQNEKFDAIIVGSDQVWRKTYINDSYYKSYFLDFIPTQSNTKKIAYAASFGKDYWEGKGDSATISKLLSDFDAISVREASGIDICKSTFGIPDVKHVLDPTLLMSKDFYLEIIAKHSLANASSKKITTYVLDESEEKKIVINYFKSELQAKSDDILHLKGFNTSQTIFTIPEWLHSLYNSDFVITDSFHGMIFSLIFNKEFIVIGNPQRGLERFESLLDFLNLMDRMIDSRQYQEYDLKPINYLEVNQRLEQAREYSLEFLQRSLNIPFKTD